jgi:hypothetical protein
MSDSDLVRTAHEIKAHAQRSLEQENAAMRANEIRWRMNSSKQIASLSPPMQMKVKGILQHLSQKHWQPVVVHGRRTHAEQLKKVHQGYSSIINSLHVEGAKQQKAGFGHEPIHTTAQAMVAQYGPYIIRGEAADIVDARWGWLGPCRNLHHAFWNDLGAAARQAGLVWGGLWRSKRDVAHVEMQKYETTQDMRFIRA